MFVYSSVAFYTKFLFKNFNVEDACNTVLIFKNANGPLILCAVDLSLYPVQLGEKVTTDPARHSAFPSPTPQKRKYERCFLTNSNY